MADTRLKTVFKKLGWTGTALLLGALFFLTGALVSLLDGDLGVAMQSVVVGFLLVGGVVWVWVRGGLHLNRSEP